MSEKFLKAFLEKFTNELPGRLLNELEEEQILKNSVMEIFKTKLQIKKSEKFLKKCQEVMKKFSLKLQIISREKFPIKSLDAFLKK